MKRFLLTLVFLFSLSGGLHAQNAYYSDHAFRYNTGFPAYPAASAVISVCQFTAIGLPCTPLAPICSGPNDTLCQSPNPFNADNNGNFGFWASPGNYIVTITGANVSGYTLTVSIPIGAGFSGTFPGNITFSGNLTFTGTNTHSGAETFNGGITTSSLTVPSLSGCLQAGAGGVITSIGSSCGSSGGSVTVTGSPSPGNLSIFSSGTSITNGDLSGDVSTSGTTTTVVNAVHGVSYPSGPSTNTVPIVTASNSVAYVSIPNCSALAYNTSTSSFSCGNGGSVLQSFTNRNLASAVSVSAGTPTTIDGISVTMPSSGGPFRVRVNYWYYETGGGNFGCWATDVISGIETHSFAGYGSYPNNSKGGCNSSGLSPVTYTAGQTVTFRTKMSNGGSATVQTTNPYGNFPSAMQVEVFASN